jgi:hypothetical protein
MQTMREGGTRQVNDHMVISGDKKKREHYIVGQISTLTCYLIFIFLALKLN